jgi:D-lactate dehydrogenase
MNVVFYSTRSFERPFLEAANIAAGHTTEYLDIRLSEATLDLARSIPAVSIFVGDDASAPILQRLWEGGTRLLALRSAGFNHVDVEEAERIGMTVLRVPAYSPYAVAEHTVALMLTLNRKLHRAFNRVREQNFALDGLMGFDMHSKTAGVIGTGAIGRSLCRILTGFGCRILATDPVQSVECTAMGVRYVALSQLLAESDIVTLHCPLTPATRHLINAQALAAMKPSAMLINTSRGAIVDTLALIHALKRGQIGSVGLDVYEEETALFFKDLSAEVIQDDVFVRLLTFPNVLITAHQGFLTREALVAIATQTARNITDFERGAVNDANRVGSKHVVPGRR